MLTSVRAFDVRAERVVELSNADCQFTYRRSLFNTAARGRFVVLGVRFSLSRRGQPTLRYPDVRRVFEGRPGLPSLGDVREAVLRVRASKAMLLADGDPDCRSVGSFFKNPILGQDVFSEIEAVARRNGLLAPDEQVPRFLAPDGMVKTAAAWLIEKSGFPKGYALGSVGLSTKHALALVNRGDATARDVLALAGRIRRRVDEQFGVRLRPEPIFVGFDEDTLAEFDAEGLET